MEVAKALLRHQANCEVVDRRGFTPSGLAAYWNHRDVLEVLLDFGASVTPPALPPQNWPLPQAAELGHLELGKWLLPLHPADSRHAALQAAIDNARYWEKTEVLEYLLSVDTAADPAK